MKLVELRDAIKAGKRLYRKAWPAYAAWTYDPLAGLRFIDRKTHAYFWGTVMGDALMPGVPAGLLEADDVYADDWERLD